MAAPIEDYALIGDTHTAALVSREGSIDWLCLPRFDSPACFAALLGDRSNGRWLLAPAGPVREVRRRYQGDTLALETEFHTDEGVVRVVDCMPPRQRDPDVARVVECVRGRVRMQMELTIRFDYGSIVPWVRNIDGALHAIAGPKRLAVAAHRQRAVTAIVHLDFDVEATVSAGEPDLAPAAALALSIVTRGVRSASFRATLRREVEGSRVELTVEPP